MTEPKPPIAQEIAARQTMLRRRCARFAAKKLREISRWELCSALDPADVQEGDLQAVEDELFRIIHYLEKGRR